MQTASLVGTFVGGLVYFAVLLDLRWAPGRTAVPLRYASNFFDVQAQALMSGHLAVPKDSLGIEGFVIGERTYMYFPPFPALIRIPVFLITEEFVGRLTVVSMAVAWIVFAVMAVRMTWLVGRLILGDREPTRRECVGAAILIAALTGGTVLTFDASLPWVYHEVYVWAIATVVGALYWLIRMVLEPKPRHAAWLTGFALAAAWTRTTGGFAVVGAIMLAAGWLWVSQYRRRDAGEQPQRIAGHHLMGLAAAIPLVGSVAVNMAKFNHVYMFPLQNQVWTQVNERRREALQANGGTITGPQFLEPTFTTYFAIDGLRFTDYFPWVSLPADPPALDGSAFFDQTYRAASVTATTPLLLLLLLIAILLLLLRPRLWRILVPPLLGAIAVGLPVLMYGYIAYRYTSEFVPALVVGGIIGYWMLAPRLLRGPRVAAWSMTGVMATLTVYSIVVQVVLGLTMSAITQGGDPLHRYLRWQERISGGPGSAQAGLTIQTEDLPEQAPADTIAIVDGCSRLYLATGDRYEPWALVDAEPVVIEGTLGRDISPGLVKVATVVATTPRDVLVEVRDDHHVRVVVRDGDRTVDGEWFGVYPNTSFRIGIDLHSGFNLASITSTPGGYVTYVPAVVRDVDWFTTPGHTVVAPGGGNAYVGLSFREVPPRGSPLCRSLQANSQAPAADGLG